jgi:hypothetical protein
VSGPLFEAFDAWVAAVRAPQDQPTPRHVTLPRYRELVANIDEAHYPDPETLR